MIVFLAARIFLPEDGLPAKLKISKTLQSLTEFNKEHKKKSVDMVIRAFGAMEKRNIRDVFKLLEDCKERIEKDFKNAENILKEKVMNAKISIFVGCLLKSYNPETLTFLPTDLMPHLAKEKIVKKIRKCLQRLNESIGRKKSDSQWKKFGKLTIERSTKESPAELGLMDNLYRW